MSEAPETIWATSDYRRIDQGKWWDSNPGGDSEEYRRADLPPTTEQLEADPRVKALVDALSLIDALDPEGMAHGCSQSALIGLVLRMGETARTALAQLKETKE